VISETLLESVDNEGLRSSIVRTGTYVFRKGEAEKWVCVIDNSYGADLLKAGSKLVSRLSNIDYYFPASDLQEVLLGWHGQSSGYRLKQRS
jgi:hypothetical protein